MKFIKRTMLILFILFFCVGCDQVTKSIAKKSLKKLEAQKPVISSIPVLRAELHVAMYPSF
jgi:hypothetical protein